eukprot:2728118-Prymnesium_polylepis.1
MFGFPDISSACTCCTRRGPASDPGLLAASPTRSADAGTPQQERLHGNDSSALSITDVSSSGASFTGGDSTFVSLAPARVTAALTAASPPRSPLLCATTSATLGATLYFPPLDEPSRAAIDVELRPPDVIHPIRSPETYLASERATAMCDLGAHSGFHQATELRWTVRYPAESFYSIWPANVTSSSRSAGGESAPSRSVRPTTFSPFVADPRPLSLSTATHISRYFWVGGLDVVYSSRPRPCALTSTAVQPPEWHTVACHASARHAALCSLTEQVSHCTATVLFDADASSPSRSFRGVIRAVGCSELCQSNWEGGMGANVEWQLRLMRLSPCCPNLRYGNRRERNHSTMKLSQCRLLA